MRLTVSKGPEPVTITSVVGMTVADATAQLEPDRLALAPTEVYSDTVAPGLIVDQSPVAGAEGHRGDTIAVNVSKGPEFVTMPNVVSKQFDAAKAQLEKLGLTVKRENVLGGIFGTVRVQSAPADQPVKVGTEILLTVV